MCRTTVTSNQYAEVNKFSAVFIVSFLFDFCASFVATIMSGVHRDAIQKQIHQDWANREYIEVITASIKRITDFLNSFGEFIVFVYSIGHSLIASMLLFFFSFRRYVVPITFGCAKRKTNCAGTAHRLLGGMRDKGGNINVMVPFGPTYEILRTAAKTESKETHHYPYHNLLHSIFISALRLANNEVLFKSNHCNAK